MIKLEMQGRLGNQMFRYAFARNLQIKTSLPIIVSFNYVKKNHQQSNIASFDRGWENSLQFFKVQRMQEYTGKHRLLFYKVSVLQTIVTTIFYLYRKRFKYNNPGMTIEISRAKQLKWAKILDSLGAFCIPGHYPSINFSKRNFYIDGSFEIPECFNNIRDTLLEEFTPKEPPLKENANIYKLFNETESVCVSIRTFKEIKDRDKRHQLYNVCSMDYFIKAMTYIKSIKPNVVFFICSDDIEWIKKNVDLSGFNVIYENGQNPVWEKLRLMYSCKHFIISNSTFSWWAQYLSRNNEKIVIAPKKWFNDDYQGFLIENWMIKM